MEAESDKIIQFLKDNIEPIPDSIFGDAYRASAYLTDGTFLPCVIFRNPRNVTNLAIRRFKEERRGKGILKRLTGGAYYNVVKGFVTNGNCINHYDVAEVEKSRYAFPLSIMKQINGETTMGWTGFSLRMKDGKYFGFGSTFRFDFFQMPENYLVDDIEEVINHSYVSDTGEVCYHRVPFSNIRKTTKKQKYIGKSFLSTVI
ncbi:MAG: hypothetical protein J7497_13590 [Chitinophagaceae bacterium]|nr:hypothetical protein [Chitinophagaceae bacterium]